jgi:large subunit ribosomal protein L24
MKKDWSPKWIGSSQPRKQRKYRYNAPLHARRKFLSAHLSKELRERYGKRSIPLRKGDGVVVMKGGFRGFTGNIDRIDMSMSKVYIDGVKRKKVDGSETMVPIDPSNVMITKLTLEDKMRQAVFERAAPRSQKPVTGEKQKPEKEPKKARPKKPAKER